MIQGETILSGAPLKEGVSVFMVLHSFAGWYVGTMFKDPVDGFEEPNSRETDYFETEAEAQSALDSFNKGDDLTGMRT